MKVHYIVYKRAVREEGVSRVSENWREKEHIISSVRDYIYIYLLLLYSVCIMLLLHCGAVYSGARGTRAEKKQGDRYQNSGAGCARVPRRRVGGVGKVGDVIGFRRGVLLIPGWNTRKSQPANSSRGVCEWGRGVRPVPPLRVVQLHGKKNPRARAHTHKIHD